MALVVLTWGSPIPVAHRVMSWIPGPIAIYPWQTALRYWLQLGPVILVMQFGCATTFAPHFVFFFAPISGCADVHVCCLLFSSIVSALELWS